MSQQGSGCDWRDRHGKLRIYFRRGKGPRIPLPITIGTSEFNTAYESALVGGIEVKHNRRERELRGTIAAPISS